MRAATASSRSPPVAPRTCPAPRSPTWWWGPRPWPSTPMWDGSAVGLKENLQIARELLSECKKAKIVLEIEIGVVGGEEDGVVGEINEKLYSTPEDALATAEALGTGENGRYLLAATFGNVHGVYQAG